MYRESNQLVWIFKNKLFEGGFLSRTGHAYYYVTDYQGGIIAVIDEKGNQVEEYSYYPYGEPHRLTGTKINPYLYGGKEYLDHDGLNFYDYSARNHMPSFPRFDRIDPKCERFPGMSTYIFCASNPLRFKDPSGMTITLSNSLDFMDFFNVALQLSKITSDNLNIMKLENGSFQLNYVPTENNYKPYGTYLIRTLINSKFDTEIDVNNSAKNFKTNENQIKFLNPTNARNGTGSNTLINYCTSDNLEFLTQVGNGKPELQGRPPYIGLVHELIHSYYSIYGAVMNGVTELEYINENGVKMNVITDIEELKVIGISGNSDYAPTENKIRQEHNLGIRVRYYEK